MTCYVPAEAVKPLRYQFADITIADAVVPQALEQGGSFTVAGEISSVYSDIDAVHIQVTDPQGKVAMGATMQKNSGVYELANDFQPEKGFESLEEGVYTYRLYADGQCSYVQDGKAQTMIQEVTLCSVSFTVGNCDLPWLAEGFAEQPQNGWVLDREKWYYFENGEPRTGWFCQDGVQYYLQEDGAVTTGWAEINGKQRFFTDTGAMRTGWLDTAAGKMYLLSNGVTACGWRTIAGELYYFDENGLMYTGGWLTVGDERYYLQSDGTAAAGWITLDEGNFCFHETDGHLLAQAVGDGAQTVLQAYDAQKGAITDRPTPGIKNAITSA